MIEILYTAIAILVIMGIYVATIMRCNQTIKIIEVENMEHKQELYEKMTAFKSKYLKTKEELENANNEIKRLKTEIAFLKQNNYKGIKQ
jgi:predicted RNase H-like nuclease (RuvC/YqgF family)